MLTIKDAGRYANFLSNLISQIENLMYSSNNYTKTIESHFRSKSNPEAEDEIIEIENDRIFSGQIQNICYLAQKLIDEKLQLSLAIESAKNNLDLGWEENGIKLTLDTAYEYNKNIRTLMSGSYVGKLINVKPSIRKTTGKSYKINVEGNQSPYIYDVETKTDIDFDKKIIKDLNKKLLDKADKISTLIDQAELKEIVDFEPTYDIRDSFEDIISIYESNLNN